MTSQESSQSNADEEEQLFHPTVSSNKWLLAKYDPEATFIYFSSCICFADLHGDGDSNWLLPISGRAPPYEIESLSWHIAAIGHAIVDIPAGIVAFHMDSNDPQTPALAVASGSYLYIYKNLKPFL